MTSSPVLKRSVIVNGKKTSISLEDPFFLAAKEAAADMEMTFGQLCGYIEQNVPGKNLSSRIRLFVLSAMQTEIKILRQEKAA